MVFFAKKTTPVLSHSLNKEIRNVAIIGGGSSGIIMAKYLKEFGFDFTLFEQGEAIGGVWVYKEEHKKPLPYNQFMEWVESSGRWTSAMYSELTTNLPFSLMKYCNSIEKQQSVTDNTQVQWAQGDTSSMLAPSLSFEELVRHAKDEGEQEGDISLFPHHSVIRTYLEDYAKESGIVDHIRCQHEVVHCLWSELDQDWKVKVYDHSKQAAFIVRFDAIAVCNGHYWKPFVPNIPGINNFKGVFNHTREFRYNSEYANQHVLVIGGGFSGIDIGHQLTNVSKITLSVKKDCVLPQQYTKGMTVKPEIEKVTEDGHIHFADGTIETTVDVILFATGFLYEFPFFDKYSQLPSDGFPLTSNGNGEHLSWLYKQLLYVYNPTLCFLGLPVRVVPFPLAQYQASAVAKFWRKLIDMPPQKQLVQECIQEEQECIRNGQPLRKLHWMGKTEFQYCNDLAQWSGNKEYERWRMELRQVSKELKFRESGFSIIEI